MQKLLAELPVVFAETTPRAPDSKNAAGILTPQRLNALPAFEQTQFPLFVEPGTGEARPPRAFQRSKSLLRKTPRCRGRLAPPGSTRRRTPATNRRHLRLGKSRHPRSPRILRLPQAQAVARCFSPGYLVHARPLAAQPPSCPPARPSPAGQIPAAPQLLFLTGLVVLTVTHGLKLRARRKPRTRLRMPGESPSRRAERQLTAVLTQPPPRRTRMEPDDAPLGSLTLPPG